MFGALASPTGGFYTSDAASDVSGRQLQIALDLSGSGAHHLKPKVLLIHSVP